MNINPNPKAANMATTSSLPTTFTTVRGGAVVRRIVCTSAATEVSVWRRANRRPTFQGEVEVRGGGWLAWAIFHSTAGEERFSLGTFSDEDAAVDALVKHRSGHPARIAWTGPRP